MHLRSVLLIALPLLAGCASVPSPRSADPSGDSWRRIQTARLAKLHGERDYASALERLRENRPQGAQGQGDRARTQEPKIDQREPAAIGARRYHVGAAPLRVVAQAGVGNLEVVSPPTTASDRTAAAFLRVGIDGNADAASGPALHFRAMATDRELFGKSLINDGVVPAHADARVVGLQAFPHMRMTALDGTDAAFPVRFGVAVSHVDVEHHRAGVDRAWLTVAPRLELEPRLVLLGAGDNRLDLFGRFGGEFGYGWFREDFRGGSDSDRMAQWSYDAGVGLRWHHEDWWLDFGYEFGQTRLAGTNTELFRNASGTILEQQKLFLGGTLKF